MSLIPALLPLMKPQIHSIDRKGRATISIRLLSNEWMDQPNAFTVTKSYRTHTEDLIIMVKQPKKKDSLLFTMDHIVGHASKLDTWFAILPHRIGISNPAKHRYLGLRPFASLTQSPHGVPMEIRNRKFLLVDSPGTVDREDGIWFDSNDDFGVFVVDLPSQFGWTDNRKTCTQILSEQWIELRAKHIGTTPTRTFYLPQ